MDFRNQIYAWMDAVESTAPLVHSITNYVTVNDCANALLAIGARPVMSHDPREAAEITRGSQALELNLGATEYIDAMFLSGQAALEKGIPRVIDPVGISGSTFRRETLRRMITELQPTAIRGNYSEIHALLANAGTGTGVDAVTDAAHPALSGDALARGMQDYLRTLAFPMILVASGREDIVASSSAISPAMPMNAVASTAARKAVSQDTSGLRTSHTSSSEQNSSDGSKASSLKDGI